ncbi:MAG: hypothetical protein H6744_15280 [Deltaproteobacteria bacterium]|nr:hypothetical protein [Deltaproteobacteria bacterium]MCB9788044.1 hypothetical protein [Deltaproteobacteria bacterium]
MGSGGGARAIEDGFYVALGVGAASASGTRGVRFDTRGACASDDGGPYLWAEADADGALRCVYARDDPTVGEPVAAEDIFREMSRTRFGSGAAAQVRLGWNIRGHVSLELVAMGHGKARASEGAAHLSVQIRWHPAELSIDHDERAWDFNLFYGTGYSVGAYHPSARLQQEVQPDTPDARKAFEGLHQAAGVGMLYQLSPHVAVGMDLRFIFPQYLSWIVDRGEGIRSLTEKTPRTVIFAPTVELVFHLGRAKERADPGEYSVRGPARVAGARP